MAVSSTALSIIGIFALVGVAFLALGLAIALSATRFRRRAVQTQGTIAALRSVSSRMSRSSTAAYPDFGDISSTGTGLVYRPTVTFTTSDGRQIRAESRFATNPPPGRVGERVRVRYDPQDPEQFRIDTLRGGGGCLAFVFISIGAVFTTGSVAAFVLVSR